MFVFGFCLVFGVCFVGLGVVLLLFCARAKKKVGIFKPILSIKEKAIEMISSLISTQKIILEGEEYLIFFIVYLGNQVDPEKNCEVTSYEINDEGKVKQLQVSYTSIIY